MAAQVASIIDVTIRILEYAISENPLRRFIMKLWAPWVRFTYGAEFDRHTEQYLESAGLDLVEKKFLYKDIIKLLTVRPRVSGSAVKLVPLDHFGPNAVTHQEIDS